MPPATDLTATAPAPRRAVVVLGMHRSGTSLAAGCLHRLGLNFGPRLMPPDADNPRGYFEHNDVVNLHDRLLISLDRRWDDTGPLPDGWWLDERLAPFREQLLAILRRDFPVAPLWGLKDPRLCRLLPWWEAVWKELEIRPLFVLMRRSPVEVAASLARREGTSAGKAHLLWLRHVLEAEHWSRPHDRLMVDFDDLIRDERAALAPVFRLLGLPMLAVPTRSADAALGRQVATSSSANPPLWAEEADAALKLGLAGRESEMRHALDDLSAAPFLAQSTVPEVKDLLTEAAATRKQARWYEAEWRKAQARVKILEARLDKQQGNHRSQK